MTKLTDGAGWGFANDGAGWGRLADGAGWMRVAAVALAAGLLLALAPAPAQAAGLFPSDNGRFKSGAKCTKLYVKRYKLVGGNWPGPGRWVRDGIEWGFAGRPCPF